MNDKVSASNIRTRSYRAMSSYLDSLSRAKIKTYSFNVTNLDERRVKGNDIRQRECTEGWHSLPVNNPSVARPTTNLVNVECEF
jgi:hypothetical protein